MPSKKKILSIKDVQQVLEELTVKKLPLKESYIAIYLDMAVQGVNMFFCYLGLSPKELHASAKEQFAELYDQPLIQYKLPKKINHEAAESLLELITSYGYKKIIGALGIPITQLQGWFPHLELKEFNEKKDPGRTLNDRFYHKVNAVLRQIEPSIPCYERPQLNEIVERPTDKQKRAPKRQKTQSTSHLSSLFSNDPQSQLIIELNKVISDLKHINIYDLQEVNPWLNQLKQLLAHCQQELIISSNHSAMIQQQVEWLSKRMPISEEIIIAKLVSLISDFPQEESLKILSAAQIQRDNLERLKYRH